MILMELDVLDHKPVNQFKQDRPPATSPLADHKPPMPPMKKPEPYEKPYMVMVLALTRANGSSQEIDWLHQAIELYVDAEYYQEICRYTRSLQPFCQF